MIESVEHLNGKFLIEGHVRFDVGQGGLSKAVIHNEHASAEIYLHGANITSYHPRDHAELLWMSSKSNYSAGKPIRGGIPICWPWFAQHPTDPNLPQHGFARIAAWQVVGTRPLNDGATQLVLQLRANDQTLAIWPYEFELELTMTIGRSLQMQMRCRNLGDASFLAGGALHTYFDISDIERIRIDGLDGCRFTNQLDGSQANLQVGAITIREETDRVYVDTESDVTLTDQLNGRRIRLSKQGSASTVVWNPWVAKASRMDDFPDDGFPTMVCIETANALEDTRRVAPGGEHTLGHSISFV